MLRSFFAVLVAFVLSLTACSGLDNNPFAPNNQKSGISIRIPIPSDIRPSAKVLQKVAVGYEQVVVTATTPDGSSVSNTFYPEEGYVDINMELSPGHYTVVVAYQVDFRDRFRSRKIEVDVVVGEVKEVTVVMYAVTETGQLNLSVFWDRNHLFFPDTTGVISTPDDSSSYLLVHQTVPSGDFFPGNNVFLGETSYQFIREGGSLNDLKIAVATFYGTPLKNIFSGFILVDERGVVIKSIYEPLSYGGNGEYVFSELGITKYSGDKGKIYIYAPISPFLNSFDYVHFSVISLGFSGPQKMIGNLPIGTTHAIYGGVSPGVGGGGGGG